MLTSSRKHTSANRCARYGSFRSSYSSPACSRAPFKKLLSLGPRRLGSLKEKVGASLFSTVEATLDLNGSECIDGTHAGVLATGQRSLLNLFAYGAERMGYEDTARSSEEHPRRSGNKAGCAAGDGGSGEVHASSPQAA